MANKRLATIILIGGNLSVLINDREHCSNGILVFRYKDGHIFVYDPENQPEMKPQEFFDIQGVKIRRFDANYIFQFPVIVGKEREFAIDQYLQWQKTGK